MKIQKMLMRKVEGLEYMKARNAREELLHGGLGAQTIPTKTRWCDLEPVSNFEREFQRFHINLRLAYLQ